MRKEHFSDSRTASLLSPTRSRFSSFLMVGLCAITCMSHVVPGQAAEAIKSSAEQSAGFWGLQFSPNGRWLAAATNVRDHGGPIVVWRVGKWQPQIVRMEPTGGLDVAFSPDGRLLAYSTRSLHVGLLEIPSGKLVRSINAFSAEKGSVFGVTFSPDGKSLLTCGTDRMISVWSVADGSLLRTFEGHSDEVTGIALSPDGSLLLSGSSDHTSRLWDARTGEAIQVFEPADSIVRRVRFSHDGKFFLTSKWDGKTRVRETKTRQLRVVIPGGSDCAALTRDNRLLAATSYRAPFHVYRIQFDGPTSEQKERLHELIRKLDDDDYSIREAATEEIAAIGMVADPLLREALAASSPEVRMRARLLLKRVMSPEPVAELTGHRGDSEVVCFSPDDKLLATGCRGGDLKIWSVPEFKELVSLTAPVAE